MHYYKRHIGDYAKKAGRLSMLQHGAYTMLLDAYYDTERPPTKAIAIEWCWAFSAEELAAVEFVLARFFILDGDVYRQTHCDEDIAIYHGNAATNKRIAQDREAKKREEKARSVHEPLTDEHEQAPNHKPLTTNHKPTDIKHIVPGKPDDCPHQEIINIYHELIPAGTQVRIWNETRRKHLQARWREDAKRQSLEWWRKLFAYCAKSQFLTGQVSPSNGRVQFVIGLDWIVNPTNFAKIIEGKYHEATA